jgi:hypothetical protein
MAKLNGGTRIYGNATIDSFATISGNLNTVSGNVNIASGTGVTAIARSVQGSGYTAIPTITVSAPTSIGGITAVANAIMQSLTATPVAGGTGYTVGDTVSLVGGTVAIAVGTFRVATLGASNAIASMDTPNFGAYSVLPVNPVALTGGTGNAATANITYLFGTANITNAGSGYVAQPTVTFSGGGGGSGAAAYATVGASSKLQILGTSLQFYTPGGIQAQIGDTYTGGISTNFIQIRGRSAGAGPIISANGETNVSLNIAASGTGGIGFQTNNGGTNQFSVGHTASAVNYLTVTGAVADGVIPLSATGSSANVGIIIAAKGTSQLYLASGSTGGTIRFNTNGTEQVTIGGPATTQNKINLTGAANAGTPFINVFSNYDTDVGLTISSKGAGAVGFWTNDVSSGTGVRQAQVSHTANAVNYLQFTGAATGARPFISALGSDPNIDLALTPKGSGNVTTVSNFTANNITSSNIVSANNNIVVNSNSSEGGQLILAWANISGITGQANSTWNIDVDTGNSLRVFYQNAAGATNVLISASATTNVVTFSNVIKTTATVFASLPTAATAGAGARSFITDSTAATFGTVAAGGGANAVPVWSDGTNWKIG